MGTAYKELISFRVPVHQNDFDNYYAAKAFRECSEAGGQRILQIFQKTFRSLGDHRPKYFMAQ